MRKLWCALRRYHSYQLRSYIIRGFGAGLVVECRTCGHQKKFGE